jgi:hypothetical protein
MFKVTCLADPRKKVRTPRELGLESPQRTDLVQHYLIVKYTHNHSICNKHVL